MSRAQAVIQGLLVVIITAFVVPIYSINPSLAAEADCEEADTLLATTPSPPRSVSWFKRHLHIRDELEARVDTFIVGDSLAQNWPLDLFRRAGGLRPVNAGIGSDRTQQILWRLSAMELHRIAPRSVIVIVGTNNLSGLEKACAISAGIMAVIRKVRAIWSDAKITFVEIPPRGEKFKDFECQRQSVNSSVRAQVRKIANAETFNADSIITCGYRVECTNLNADRLHLSHSGYVSLTAALRSAGRL
ncbi:GDSL-type esterase/lipase family protein [Methylobacterium oxalidis]|uniref:GDSL-type esterase/lipase family protein n=1 Tax=Methylobacterium oxalidis TaxID=944322 RepID=UPI0011BF0C46|nr:GDSL-type esterase/lipase family protein [Methylobacterium oxalidis]